MSLNIHSSFLHDGRKKFYDSGPWSRTLNMPMLLAKAEKKVFLDWFELVECHFHEIENKFTRTIPSADDIKLFSS
jgi:hypothetical protein